MQGNANSVVLCRYKFKDMFDVIFKEFLIQCSRAVVQCSVEKILLGINRNQIRSTVARGLYFGESLYLSLVYCDRSGSTVTKFLLTRKGESEDSIEVLILVLDPVTDTVLKEFNSAFMPQPDA